MFNIPTIVLACLCYLGAWLFPLPIDASQVVRINYSTGTGFFVSRRGYVVTNAHVLPECVAVEIRTSKGEQFEGTIVGMDNALDLALIKTPTVPKHIARMRHQYTRIHEDEKVAVIGYPMNRKDLSRYEVRYSSVKDVVGPSGETEWLQFEEAASQGNSGGPLLDFAGNVVGVVKGKNTRYRINPWTNKEEVIDHSDVAISLPVLKKFLQKHRIPYEKRTSLMKLSKREIERTGSQFIVHVLCQQPG